MPQSIINGVPNNFGVPSTVNKKGAVICDDGLIRTAVYEFNASDVPVNSATDIGVLTLPAYTTIMEALLVIETPFSGGDWAGIKVGLVQPDGTAIDDDGIFTSIANAAMDTKGKLIRAFIKDSDGTDGLTDTEAGVFFNVGPMAAHTTVPAQVIVSKTSGTTQYTAGKAHLYVRYVASPFA